MINVGDKIEANNEHFSFNYGGNEYTNLTARNKFITKVYTILGGQLLVTVGFVLLSMFNHAFYTFQMQNFNLFWVALIGSIASLTILGCCPGMSTNFPINWILFTVFTLFESYIVSFVCTLYTPDDVLNAAIATLAATLGLTLYAVKTKNDFSDSYSKCYGKLEII